MGFKVRFWGNLFFLGVLLIALPDDLKAKTDDSSMEMTIGEDSQISYSGPKIKVNVAARQLMVFDEQDRHVKTYPISVGSPSYKTPLGRREMTEVVWNPWWIPPKTSAWAKGARDTPPGPNNPLGPVKMKLGNAIMFHGTNKPKSIGHAQSHGCMRMFSDDAKELAGWIQQRVINSKTTPESYEEFMAKVQSNQKSSFAVQIDNPIPIDVVYEIAEVIDGKLNVYQDIYWRVKDKIKAVEESLVTAGYKIKDFDMDYLGEQIKLAKNSQDLSFELKHLLKKNKHLRENMGKMASNELED